MTYTVIYEEKDTVQHKGTFKFVSRRHSKSYALGGV